MNDWKPIYQLVEYAVLHEMKEFHRNKNPTHDNAKLLELAAAAVNFTRETSLRLAGIGPPVPLESGLEDTSAPKPVAPPKGAEWKNILSKKERQELEAMSDLAQGVVYTAIAKQGKPSAQVGMIDAGLQFNTANLSRSRPRARATTSTLARFPRKEPTESRR